MTTVMAISQKNSSILLKNDQGKEVWFKMSQAVKRYVEGNIKKGDGVEVTVKGEYVNKIVKKSDGGGSSNKYSSGNGGYGKSPEQEENTTRRACVMSAVEAVQSIDGKFADVTALNEAITVVYAHLYSLVKGEVVEETEEAQAEEEVSESF